MSVVSAGLALLVPYNSSSRRAQRSPTLLTNMERVCHHTHVEQRIWDFAIGVCEFREPWGSNISVVTADVGLLNSISKLVAHPVVFRG